MAKHLVVPDRIPFFVRQDVGHTLGRFDLPNRVPEIGQAAPQCVPMDCEGHISSISEVPIGAPGTENFEVLATR